MRTGVAVGVLCILAWAGVARAQESRFVEARGLGEGEIAKLANQLGAAGEAQRAAAVRALRELHEESLPGIEARLRSLRRSRPPVEAARAALTAFRHAAGSLRADDATDLALGIEPTLRTLRDAPTLAVAEPLLLLRALERIATPAAGLRMADVLTLDPDGLWEGELVRARARVGMPLLPALIVLRSHADPKVRAFAQAGVRTLGMEDAAVALASEDSHLVAQLCLAYSEPLEFQAMPALVRLVASDKHEVRQAARAAVARFGKNAIWSLRELFAELATREADKSWDAERTARELYGVIDRKDVEEADTLLAQGMARFVAGDLAGMRARYDRLLAREPDFAERAKMAPGYAALGDERLAHDDLGSARAAYARALRLAPSAGDREHLRAQLAYVDAELSLSHGVVDLAGYAQALAHEPSHAAAKEAADRLSGEKQARERMRRRAAAAFAVILLVLLIGLALRGRRARGAAVAVASEPSS